MGGADLSRLDPAKLEILRAKGFVWSDADGVFINRDDTARMSLFWVDCSSVDEVYEATNRKHTSGRRIFY